MKLSLLLASFFGSLLSCKNEPTEIFTGIWKIDSSTNGPGPRLSKPYQSGTLILEKNGNYSYKWKADDASGTYKGKFLLRDSINGTKVLQLETAANRYLTYIILEADYHRMKTMNKQSYGYGDSTIYFDMIDIFKKIEARK